MLGERLPSIDDVRAAAVVLASIARETPVLQDPLLDELVGAEVLIKAEFLQLGGAFKFRGIFNKLSHLAQDELERGIVIASSGNAGLAASLAAHMRGTSSVVVMAEGGAPAKKAAIEAAGGVVVVHGHSSDEALDRARQLAEQEGRTFVHPFDQPEVIAGQGTVALELDRQASDLDAVLVPAGGGGLLAGVSLVFGALRPDVEIVGVEPEGANSIQRSLANGRVTPVDVVSTIAEGLGVRRCGSLTFDVIARHVDRIATVSDDALLTACGVFWSTLHVAVEPSGAAGLALLLSGEQFRGKRVAVIASGANIATERLAEAVAASTIALQS
jgi:threonine dehydratase